MYQKFMLKQNKTTKTNKQNNNKKTQTNKQQQQQQQKREKKTNKRSQLYHYAFTTLTSNWECRAPRESSKVNALARNDNNWPVRLPGNCQRTLKAFRVLSPEASKIKPGVGLFQFFVSLFVSFCFALLFSIFFSSSI